MVRVFVEEIPSVYLCCDTLITAEDVASASRFQNERRRAEHLAWRRMVRRELGRDVHIDYNAVGAPVVDSPDTWIGVSHSKDVVAVAIADEMVGIDIEYKDRDFERAKSRYMSPEEEMLSSDSLWTAYMWTAKEAMYKLYGRRGVELRDDLRVESFDSTTMTMRCTLAGDSRRALIEVELREEEIIVAVATFEKFDNIVVG